MADKFYLWLDDILECPKYIFNKQFDGGLIAVCASVNQAIEAVKNAIKNGITEFYFDLDHDLGDFASDGGDAIKFVDWLVETYHNVNLNFNFHFHSMNPVELENMKNAVERYWSLY